MKRLVLKPAVRRHLVLFVAIAVGVWFLLGRMGDSVGWLTVEAPRRAIAGRSLPVRIHVAGLKESSQLCVDLHWSSTRGSSSGFLSSGGSKPVGSEGGSFDFEITVRDTNDLRFVHGIIYLSPTGGWDDHTFVARTDLIPVTTNRDGGESTLARLSVYQLFEGRQRESAHSTPVPRVVTGILLLAASVLAWMTSRSISSSQKTSGTAHRWWQVITVGLASACIWELLGLENRVGSLAREWAHAGDVYYSRAWFQRAAISGISAAALVLLGFMWSKQGPHRITLFFLGLYLAISIVNLLSLHSVDQYARISWLGVSLIEALKFICAAAAIKGVLHARR